jgi:hypothetical protein
MIEAIALHDSEIAGFRRSGSLLTVVFDYVYVLRGGAVLTEARVGAKRRSLRLPMESLMAVETLPIPSRCRGDRGLTNAYR